MNIEYYNEYLKYKNLGIKSKVKEYIDYFVDSFLNYDEKELWALEYLPTLKINNYGRIDCIRYELFEKIIFPVLLNGYKNQNIELMIWLVRFNDNYYGNNDVNKIMNYKTLFQIINECYEIDPKNNEVIDLYLEILIDEISFNIHHYPSVILTENIGTKKDQCKKLLEELPFIHKLDRNKKYYEFLTDYENNIKEYMERTM